MLKANLPSYLDSRNEEESAYVTSDNGRYVRVTDLAITEPKSDHDLADVYFLTPIFCIHCEDYIWGTGKVGVKCRETVFKVKNSDLIHVWISSEKSAKLTNVLNRIKIVLNIDECTDSVEEKLTKISETYCLVLSRKWKECSRNKKYLFQRHHIWLNKDIIVPKDILVPKRDNGKESQPCSRRGRPEIPFADASLKTKRRRVQDLISSRTSEELHLAAEISKSSVKTTQSHPTLLPHEIIALYLDLDLSERKYEILRSFINTFHNKCFPCLKEFRCMKKTFLPSNLVITEISVKISVQCLLNKTIDSIVHMINIGDSTELKLICKWGFDGSSGHSVYKQKFTENSFETDEFIFVIALVPLKLIDVENNNELWTNPRPSSTFFCRPIKFVFMKESETLIRLEESLMNKEIENLSLYSLSLNGKDVQVNFMLHFTMLDGSVTNILSNTNSCAKCYICGASPKEMNSSRVTEKPTKVEQYRFGLSTLHSWIRFFECLLHISYRLPFKKWQVRGDANKELLANNKKRIQQEFKSRLGLIVDKVKPGYGTSNDGNTARRFFSNSDISSSITGVDKNLIQNFYTILRVIASTEKINISTFKALLKDTRELYLDKCEWYYMPITVHKVLVHGCDIINHFNVPIGLLSEEALEARHKEIRKHRLNHTRKTSREHTNTDLFNMLFLTSDPLISSHRKTSTKKHNTDLTEIEQYLIINNLNESNNLENLCNLQISSSESEDSE